MPLPLGDFIGRFLLHVLPKGFQRLTRVGVTLCPVCGKGCLVCIRELHRARDGPV
jgi:hypothetical protein